MNVQRPVSWWAPRRCNCLLWAVVQFWCHGGALAVVRSEYGWWCHFAWSPDEGLTWFNYSPTWPKAWWAARWWRRWLPPPLFEGVILPRIR